MMTDQQPDELMKAAAEDDGALAAPSEPMDIETLTEQVATLQARAEEYLDGWKRAKADYVNLKRDSEKHASELIQFSNAALLVELLPIVDNFKIAWRHIPTDQQQSEWMQGLTHIKNQLTEFLKRLGIEEVPTVGEPFNPDLHQALVHEPQEGYTPGTIFEEVKSGYTLNGKLLQPAQVKVAQ